MIFVEARIFTNRLKEFLSDEAYRGLQKELVDNPGKGVVMRGCGGLRKLRAETPSRGRGKRGGARVIYLHIPEVDQIHFVAIYGKHEQDDLTAKQRRALMALASRAKADAIKFANKGRQ